MSIQEARQALMGEAVAPYHVLRYDLWYDLDPAGGYFGSHQSVTLSNDTVEPQLSVSFLLHADLCVDEVRLCAAQQGGMLPATVQVRPAVYRGRDYHLVTLTLHKPLPVHAVVELELSCHLAPQQITRGQPGGTDRLVVDTDACYAVNASLGHFPLLALGDAATLAAPYTLNLTYPEGWLSCVPGSLTSTNTDGARRQDTYDCPKPNLPAFSCAPYKRTVIERQGLSLELLHYRGQEHLRALMDRCFALIALYADRLGVNGLRNFQLATIGGLGEQHPWIECHGNALYLNDAGLGAVADDSRVLEEALARLAHELFHSWNLFHAPVDGPMSMWISEGLANWAAAWALEQVLGPEAGARCRLRYLQAGRAPPARRRWPQ